MRLASGNRDLAKWVAACAGVIMIMSCVPVGRWWNGIWDGPIGMRGWGRGQWLATVPDSTARLSPDHVSDGDGLLLLLCGPKMRNDNDTTANLYIYICIYVYGCIQTQTDAELLRWRCWPPSLMGQSRGQIAGVVSTATLCCIEWYCGCVYSAPWPSRHSPPDKIAKIMNEPPPPPTHAPSYSPTNQPWHCLHRYLANAKTEMEANYIESLLPAKWIMNVRL